MADCGALPPVGGLERGCATATSQYADALHHDAYGVGDAVSWRGKALWPALCQAVQPVHALLLLLADASKGLPVLLSLMHAVDLSSVFVSLYTCSCCWCCLLAAAAASRCASEGRT